MKTELRAAILCGMLLLVFVLSCGVTASAQARNPLHFKAGYSSITKHYIFGSRKQPDLRIEMNYGINDWLEAGIYGGLTYSDGSSRIDDFRYGVNGNLRILPLLTGSDNVRLDPYVTVRIGRTYVPFFKAYTCPYTWEYGVGGGLAYYIGRKFGVFCEYTVGKESAFTEYGVTLSAFRYGLAFKF